MRSEEDEEAATNGIPMPPLASHHSPTALRTTTNTHSHTPDKAWARKRAKGGRVVPNASVTPTIRQLSPVEEPHGDERDSPEQVLYFRHQQQKQRQAENEQEQQQKQEVGDERCQSRLVTSVTVRAHRACFTHSHRRPHSCSRPHAHAPCAHNLPRTPPHAPFPTLHPPLPPTQNELSAFLLDDSLNSSLNHSVELPSGIPADAAVGASIEGSVEGTTGGTVNGDDFGHGLGVEDDLAFETALGLLNDPTTSTAIPVTEGSTHHERGLYSGGAMLPNGDILLAPGRATHVAVVNVRRRTVRHIDAGLDDGDAKYSGAVYTKGFVYLVPAHASHVLRVEPSTDTCSIFGPNLGGGNKYQGAVLSNLDGCIYCVPYDASR